MGLLELAEPQFEIKIAATNEQIRASQRLRYEVFIEEMGGNGKFVDHVNKLEKDEFDPFFEHLILTDNANPKMGVIGVYRILRSDKMKEIGRFYSEDEYDLSLLHKSNLRLLELGRSCVHRYYRGGTAMYHLWQGLSDYITKYKIDILFGVASYDNGREISPEKVGPWIQELQDLGAGEIIITNVDREGTSKGIDKDLLDLVTHNISIPLIYHGGINSISDIKHCYDAGCDGVAIASILHYKICKSLISNKSNEGNYKFIDDNLDIPSLVRTDTISQIKNKLKDIGVETR